MNRPHAIPNRQATSAKQTRKPGPMVATLNRLREREALAKRTSAPTQPAEELPYQPGKLWEVIPQIRRELRAADAGRNRQIAIEYEKIYKVAWVIREQRDELLDFCRLENWEGKSKQARPNLGKPDEVLSHLLGLLISERSKLSKARTALCPEFKRRVRPNTLAELILKSGGIGKMAKMARLAKTGGKGQQNRSDQGNTAGVVSRPATLEREPGSADSRPARKPASKAEPPRTIHLRSASLLFQSLKHYGPEVMINVLKIADDHAVVRVEPGPKSVGRSPVVARETRPTRNLQPRPPMR